MLVTYKFLRSLLMYIQKVQLTIIVTALHHSKVNRFLNNSLSDCVKQSSTWMEVLMSTSWPNFFWSIISITPLDSSRCTKVTTLEQSSVVNLKNFMKASSWRAFIWLNFTLCANEKGSVIHKGDALCCSQWRPNGFGCRSQKRIQILI